MSDPGVSARSVQASVQRSRRVSPIWILPLIALAIGVWLAWDTLSKQGPTITISFESGEGLQADQSQLKYKQIIFGTVKSLRLTPDHARVIVTVATTRQAEPLLTDATQFWVVRPRISLGSVSGLSTLLSGAYIAMLPPPVSGKMQRHFIGREEPPILQANIPGRTFLLRATRLGSITPGSPIYFRDLVAGEVLGWDFADMAESVTIRAFVRAPFDTYVKDDNRFWNASGLSVKLAGAGVQVQVESLQALLLGGIALAGCASPEPVLYTIAPVRGAVQTGGPRIIVLQRVGLARYLERSEIVRSSEDYRLAVMTNNWWGEPLSAMLSRVLIEELSQRLPGSVVLSGSGAVSVSPDASVEVDVVRLDEDAAGRLVLFAHVSVERGRRGTPSVRTLRVTEAPPTSGTPGEVAAISTAVGRLADTIAIMLVSGSAG